MVDGVSQSPLMSTEGFRTPVSSSDTELPSLHYNPFFMDEDADIIVQSSDEIRFKMYKIILAKASPIFKDMFRIPQSPPPTKLSKDSDPDYIDGIPVVRLTEDSNTLECIFRLCYPIDPPVLDKLDVVYQVLQAATKYDMDPIIRRLRNAWATVAAVNPLRAYALACMLRWEDGARVAARLTLNQPIWPLAPPLPIEFRYISGDAAIHLTSYHQNCSALVHFYALDQEWSAKIWEKTGCRYCSRSLGNQDLKMSDWFWVYRKKAAEVLRVTPSGDKVTDMTFVDDTITVIYTSPCDAPTHSMGHILEAIKLFGARIDEVVNKVEFKLDF